MKTFQEIEALRRSEDIARRKVCLAAGIHPTTWTRLQAGSASTTTTLEKLARALNGLIAEKNGVKA